MASCTANCTLNAPTALQGIGLQTSAKVLGSCAARAVSHSAHSWQFPFAFGYHSFKDLLTRCPRSRGAGRNLSLRRSLVASASADSSYDRLSSDPFLGHDYYGLLGVPANAEPPQIRRAYWQLMKNYHPDIAGQEGHDFALVLIEAYATLMDEQKRSAYDQQWKAAAQQGYVGFTGKPRSAWLGPERAQAIFVDENACIGCQECVFAAGETFTFDKATATARVKSQWADSEPVIKRALESCPVNCIHYVEAPDLPVLEYLMGGFEREGAGVYGGGWERPANVFKAARDFSKKLDRQKEALRQKKGSAFENETPAQKRARDDAAAEMAGRGTPWWTVFWSATPQWGSSEQAEPRAGSKEGRSGGWTSRQGWQTGGKREKKEWPWERLFGRASTSEVWTLAVEEADVPQMVTFLQEWSSTLASSSELPLPMPLRANIVATGVNLDFVTASNGTIASIGSLAINLERQLPDELESDSSALSEGSADLGPWVLRIERMNGTGSGPLPGEGRIVKELRGALAGRGNGSGYEAYHIPRGATVL